MTSTSPRLKFENVTKTFRKTVALSNLNVEFPETGIVGLIGRNGAGKTTLLNLASGLLLPTSGSIQTLNENASKLSDATTAKIGVVPHRPQFLAGLTVERYLEIVAAFYQQWDKDRVKALLDHFELDTKARIQSLSEGQQQKLSIIVATAHHPTLLLMDEPMSNLDPIARASTIKMLWDLLIDDGVLIVLSSHILHDIERISDSVCLLDKGKLIMNENLDDIKERHQRWSIQKEALPSLPDLSLIPGILNQSETDREITLDLSRATDPACQQIRSQLNGQLQTRNLSLDEVFPFITDNS